MAPYSITIEYSESETGAAIESTLALYAWDGSGWVKELTSVVDTANDIVTATPDHFGLWAVLGNSHLTYLSLIGRNYVSGIDLTIGGLEVTQAVQNPENNVPLVAGRPTVLRVYPERPIPSPQTAST